MNSKMAIGKAKNLLTNLPILDGNSIVNKAISAAGYKNADPNQAKKLSGLYLPYGAPIKSTQPTSGLIVPSSTPLTACIAFLLKKYATKTKDIAKMAIIRIVHVLNAG